MKWLALCAIMPLAFYIGKINGYDTGRTDGLTVGIADGRAMQAQEQDTHNAVLISMGLCSYAKNVCKAPR